MSMPANYVVVEGGRHRLSANRWRAECVPFDLFWGPECATVFARAQPTSAWREHVWCRGGFLVDHDRHVLRWFTAGDLGHDAEERRAFVSLMAVNWSGWSVAYAHEGLVDFVRHFDADPAIVRDDPGAGAQVLLEADPPVIGVDVVVSVRTVDGHVVIVPTATEVSNALRLGPRLLDHVHLAPHRLDERAAAEWEQREICVTEVRFVEDGQRETTRTHGLTSPGRAARPVTSFFCDRPPTAGIHVDERAKTVSAWSAELVPGIVDEIPALWDGWGFDFHGDDHRLQLDACEGQLRFGVRAESELLAAVADLLRCIPATDHVGMECVGDHEVGAAALALADGTRLPLPEARREQIIEAALRRVNGAT